jgi:hypothetical protein
LLDQSNYYYWESWAHYFLGATYLEMGRYADSERHHLKSIAIIEAVGIMPSCQRLNELALAVAKVQSGSIDVNMEKLKGCYQENRFRALQGWMARLIAELLLALDKSHHSEAENWIRTAIIADTATGMKLHLGRDYTIYARICSLRNKRTEARDYFSKASEIFQLCGAEGDLKKIKLKAF